jgi:type III secretory pathway component EscU
MRSIIKQKKGDIGSILIAVVLVFVIGVLAVVGLIAWKEISKELQETPEFKESNKTIESLKTMDSYASPLFDLFVVAVFVGFLLFLIISSSVIDANPAVVIGFVILLLLGAFVAAQLANAFFDFTTDEEIEDILEGDMKMTRFILGKAYPAMIAVTGFIILFVLYSRRGGTPV